MNNDEYEPKDCSDMEQPDPRAEGITQMFGAICDVSDSGWNEALDAAIAALERLKKPKE